MWLRGVGVVCSGGSGKGSGRGRCSGKVGAKGIGIIGIVVIFFL